MSFWLVLTRVQSDLPTNATQSGTPTSTIAISKLSWTKAREGMVGLASPTLIEFPPLSGIGELQLVVLDPYTRPADTAHHTNPQTRSTCSASASPKPTQPRT